VWCLVLRACLGLDIDVPAGRLTMDPWLPPFLDTVDIENLHVNTSDVRLRFFRTGERCAAFAEGLDASMKPVHG
jgi:hypothetical protein